MHTTLLCREFESETKSRVQHLWHPPSIRQGVSHLAATHRDDTCNIHERSVEKGHQQNKPASR
jgi:hypothetical protein